MQDTAYTRLLDKLDGVQRNGNTASARCPAHDDRSPSLSITGTDSRVLLHCHAGCDTDDVLAAMGLTYRDLYQQRNGDVLASYPYPDGPVVERRASKGGKDFRQRNVPKGGGKRALFHADRIADATTVYVTEGEEDVYAVEAVGGTAVSPAQGRNTKPERFDWEPLRGKDIIIIADKDDDGGGFAHAQRIADVLGGTAKSATIAEVIVGKDVSDHIAAGKTLDELVYHSLLDKLSVTGDWLDAQEFAELEYVVPELIPEGMGYLGAPPKKGKSFLVGNVALAVSSGGTALQRVRVTQRPVLYLALEDGHRRLQDRLRKMNGGQPIPAALTIVIKATPQEAIAVIGEYLARHGQDRPLVVLDTLGKVKRAKRSGEDAYGADYAISSQLKGLADSAPGSTILVVHHTRKAASDDFVADLSGTYGIAGAADFLMVLQRQRGGDDAVLHVTGRDVMESEYALHADDGMLWRLAGSLDTDDAASVLSKARTAAEQVGRLVRLMDKHGPLSVKVWHYVNDDGGQIVSPEDVSAEFGLDRRRASEVLTRLANDDYVTKLARGEYGPGI
ncbi:AAA family ATPase [Mycobacterium sp. IS-3022]|uniref:AAA family ATPase n=1 Tax=Mycobacterium sp. IS-3022 TaxID=1772277 RepID=UPI0007415716|nr:AAA family ATPase [Mycobacterium sp. IS-3022]KUH99268.1 hypothetical protein AU188_11450 [Mycobacterium sp. IS-3022]